MDSFGDHALVCPCHGDRTIRHNTLRNTLFSDAAHGGLNPEKEKAGLLCGHPPEDGLTCSSSRPGDAEEADGPARGRRRPADIYLPRGPGGRPAAIDFACTSGLRSDTVRSAADAPERVTESYEAFKRNVKPQGETESTEEECTQSGFSFIPLVMESHGGGSSHTSRRTLDTIARNAAARWNESPDTASLRIAQRLSMSLRRENARAILRRTAALYPNSVAKVLPLDDAFL